MKYFNSLQNSKGIIPAISQKSKRNIPSTAAGRNGLHAIVARFGRGGGKNIVPEKSNGEYNNIIRLFIFYHSYISILFAIPFQVNYLSADPAVREHMEPAIGTVLNFTEEDLDKVKKQKEQNES